MFHRILSRPLRSVRQIAQLSTASVSASSSSVNADEIALFSRLSDQWWNERGEFGLLHKMNPVRMQFVREKILEVAHEEDERVAAKLESTSKILNGLNVLDVGCGGGLLSEVRHVSNVPSFVLLTNSRV